MPVYTPNIPQATDNPSQSQGQMLQNFQVLNTVFGVDHADFTSPIGGQHEQITFPVGPLTGQPFTYLSGQIGLQSLNQAPTNVPDIWMARGTAAAFPITGYSINGAGTSGWTYLPSGALMAWGLGTISAAGTVVITYASVDVDGGAGVNFPGYQVMGNPQISWYNPIGAAIETASIFAYTITTFTVKSSTGLNGQFLWTAIGI